MKKTILVVILIGLCVVYFFTLRGRAVKIQEEEERNVEGILKNMITQVQENYPEDAQTVIENFNQILKCEYSRAMKIENVDLVVEVSRLLYSEELLKINPKEYQKQMIQEEVEKAKSEGKVLIGSEIQSNVKEINEGIEQTVITVNHVLGQSDQRVEYTLIKEDGKWKIYKWRFLD